MNINEVRNLSSNQQLGVLKELLQKTGNCAMNGYLGDSISSISLNSMGNIEFVSKKEEDSILTNSKGIVLSDSVLIEQEQVDGDRSYYQLFSWDVHDSVYTYIAFDDFNSMNSCYEKIRAFDVNLCREDITKKFEDMNINFDHVAQILLNQDINSISTMVDDSYSMEKNDSSFVL